MSAALRLQPLLCAICVSARACVRAELDGREVWVCRGCNDEEVPKPPPQPTTRERLLRLLQVTGPLEIGELAAALGEDDALGRAKLSAALARCENAGLVAHTGNHMDRTYYLVKQRRRGARPRRRS